METQAKEYKILDVLLTPPILIYIRAEVQGVLLKCILNALNVKMKY